MIKVTDIEKIELEKADLEGLEKVIDEKIVQTHGNYPWEEAVIEENLPMSVRNYLAKKYHTEGGWKYVYHVTSAEKGEKEGITIFMLSNIPLARNYTHCMHVIS